MRNSKKKKINRANRNAFIRVTEDSLGRTTTETRGRDGGTTNFAVVTDPTSNSTSLNIDSSNVAMRLSGSEARTLYRLLSKHYAFTGKTV